MKHKLLKIIASAAIGIYLGISFYSSSSNASYYHTISPDEVKTVSNYSITLHSIKDPKELSPEEAIKEVTNPRELDFYLKATRNPDSLENCVLIVQHTNLCPLLSHELVSAF